MSQTGAVTFASAAVKRRCRKRCAHAIRFGVRSTRRRTCLQRATPATTPVGCRRRLEANEGALLIEFTLAFGWRRPVFFGEKKIAWFGFQSEFQLRIMRRGPATTDRPSGEMLRPSAAALRSGRSTIHVFQRGIRPIGMGLGTVPARGGGGVSELVRKKLHYDPKAWTPFAVRPETSPATRHRGLTAVFCSFRRQDRIEHDLRIGRFRKRLRHFVAMIALVRVVAAKFFQERNDFRRFLLAEDREF